MWGLRGVLSTRWVTLKLPSSFCVFQAVIQGAFTSEDAVETEATGTETHYTYFPTTAVADTSTSAGAGTTATAVVTTQNSEALLGQATPTGTGWTARGLAHPNAPCQVGMGHGWGGMGRVCPWQLRGHSNWGSAVQSRQLAWLPLRHIPGLTVNVASSDV